MAAGATPTIYDPKPLWDETNLSTTEGTVYTAPSGEAGVKIESVLVCNKTASAATARLGRNDGSTTYYVAYDFSVPPDGLPYDLLAGCGPMYVAAAETVKMKAGTASALDAQGFGIEMKD